MQNDLKKDEFFKVNNLDFDFSFRQNYFPLDEKTIKIIDLYKNKCNLIFYNNEIIFSNLPKEIKVLYVNFEKEIFKTDFNVNSTKTYVKFEIEKNTAPKPIFVLYLFNGDVSHYSLINANPNSDFKIFEKFVSFDECKVNFVRQIELKENSKLKITSVEELKTINSSFITDAEIFENSNLAHSYINLNENKALNYHNITLNKINSFANVNNATFANKSDILPCFANITHKGMNTTSLIKNFAFVNEEAKVYIEGINDISKGMLKSNARQETKIYNLSNNAKSVAKPKLIIDENDVKASHACAVGNLDEQSIFYLMSRGLNRNQAKEMLIYGMVNDFLVDIFDDEEQNEVIAKMREKIKE